jgi:DNA repair protein RecO (recombination protein O)
LQWKDQGIIVALKRFGEDKTIVTLLTDAHGRHMGVMRLSKKAEQVFHLGNLCEATWQARLPEHLGTWRLENIHSTFAMIFQNPLRLEALNTGCALINAALPEREYQKEIFHIFQKFIFNLAKENWAWFLVDLELTLLKYAGIMLDFSACAATGSQQDLVFVSPRTGRAVSKAAGFPYQDRLLSLPPCLTEAKRREISLSSKELLAVLELNEYFLNRYLFGLHGLKLPEARERFKNRLARQSYISTRSE